MARQLLAVITLLAPVPAAAPAFGQPATGDPAASTQAPAAKAEPQLICRGGGQRSLGTHMRTRRRCKTAEQWRLEDEAGGQLPVGMQVTTGQNDGRVTPTPQ